jgi:hypothetical protein
MLKQARACTLEAKHRAPTARPLSLPHDTKQLPPPTTQHRPDILATHTGPTGLITKNMASAQSDFFDIKVAGAGKFTLQVSEDEVLVGRSVRSFGRLTRSVGGVLLLMWFCCWCSVAADMSFCFRLSFFLFTSLLFLCLS